MIWKVITPMYTWTVQLDCSYVVVFLAMCQLPGTDRLNAGATAHDPHTVPRYTLENWHHEIFTQSSKEHHGLQTWNFGFQTLIFGFQTLIFGFQTLIFTKNRAVIAIFLTKEDFAKRMGGRSSVEDRGDHVELWSYVHLWFWDIFSPIDLFWTYPHHQDDYIFSRASLQTCFCHLNPGVLGG